ncbi:MAG TPA: acyl--CoA ligase family protein [Chloroflexota bacterium]|nr:acyl--CoA ligase family protein [Chloroflexota bacterium]
MSDQPLSTDVPAGAIADDPVWLQKLSPIWFAQRNGEVFRNQTAVVYGDRCYTYGEFAERVNRLASSLRQHGLRPGDRVAFLCPNIPPMLEAHFAVPLAGGVLVAINVRLSAAEIGHILVDSGATFLFVDSELSPLVDSAAAPSLRMVNIFDTPAPSPLVGPSYEEFLAAGRPTPVEPWLASEYDTIAINYTSGTTGRPKGSMYSHRGAYLVALGDALHNRLGPDSRYLWTLPMFHCNGWGYTWGVLAAGGTNVCLRRFDPALVWQFIEREEITNLCAAPTILIALANHPSAHAVQLKRPLTVGTGGSPPSPTILAQFKALGIKVVHLYGLTETYGPVALCQEQPEWSGLSNGEEAKLKARQGVPSIVAGGMRVVDDAMRDVPADGETMGEVVMRGNVVMKGYYAQPEATATAFRGGWFHSGDLAVRHPDGYVELRDRMKDVVISGGENVSTIEVEGVIYQHPAVLEVAVVAIPDERWGEVPKAFVTLKAGQVVTAEEIIDFCRARLAHFKSPKAIEFGELPKTSTGKIQKYVLREREWSGREKRIN